MSQESKILAEIMRHALQTGHCMDFDIFAKVMHEGRSQDYYVRDKWMQMQTNFKMWFCELDDVDADKYMAYVLRKTDMALIIRKEHK